MVKGYGQKFIMQDIYILYYILKTCLEGRSYVNCYYHTQKNNNDEDDNNNECRRKL